MNQLLEQLMNSMEQVDMKKVLMHVSKKEENKEAVDKYVQSESLFDKALREVPGFVEEMFDCSYEEYLEQKQACIAYNREKREEQNIL